MSQPRRHSRSHGAPDSSDRRRRSSSARDEYSSRRRRPSDVESSPRDRHSRQQSMPQSPRDPLVGGLPSHDDDLPRLRPPRSRRESDLGRKRSLIRPERNRVDRDHPQYHYRQHATNMNVHPSTTGYDPLVDEDHIERFSYESNDLKSFVDTEPSRDLSPTGARGRRRRKSEPSKIGPGTRKVRRRPTRETKEAAEARRQNEKDAMRAPSLWTAYYHLVTLWCPDMLLVCFGKVQKPQQRAWREKVGLISVILLICFFVGFLTFGFTATVCPSGGPTRLRVNHVGLGYLIIHGQAYDLTRSHHPYARGIQAGENVLYLKPPTGGQDASFLFQNVNGACKGLITAAPNSDVPKNDQGDLGWYFPCNLYNQDGSSRPDKKIPYYLGYSCHLSWDSRKAYNGLIPASDVYFTWDDIRNKSRNLAVWGADVVDLDLLLWFNTSQVQYPKRFDEIRKNPAVRGVDLTLAFTSEQDRQIGQCFSEIIKVGTIDTATIGCIASKVVLYVSLAFILAIVMAKFLLALTFQWFLSKKYAGSKRQSRINSKKRKQEIEEWSNDIYRPPPRLEDPSTTMSEKSKRSSSLFPTTSRFTSPYTIERFSKDKQPPTTMATQNATATAKLVPGVSMPGSELTLPMYSHESRTSLLISERNDRRSSAMGDFEGPGPAGFVHEAVVPQPPPDWEPFGYPLAHTICLVTAYSEGADGIRTTLDSIATTEYPNSHKILLIVCDGLIKGKGETFSTPEICLSMMKDHTILPDEVQPFSYVAVASGSKRHNMAKVYSGFYDYGERSRVPHENQQRVPMVVVVKCGTPDEANTAKPGNRGKRDSQIILMSFLQKVMFDERMTELEFEMFNGIWKITGISPDYYETVLMVDADTKVFPDCITHMNSAMVKDPEIMGLCGETKIANKRDSWVTMIQVFEYFISHHLAKSFESVFGGVTCLPGCFSMYRIKSPKGGQNYWVPILANPDIVEHYSENVVDTLHKKNLLLLGEDRYLSTLMLKTFPKRKQVFVPQAVCKTTVPDKFKVLLSQRRRWINSTIHNLMELVLVRDLCGTFCFSMQFVVFIELIGTLVLPAAISFTVYLIIAAIVDAITNKPIPIIPLILLALILGLPAVLIVLTAHRWSYVFWMLVYLLSLPIWNGILPAYAYWKFDDFSWGDTRKTAGEKTKKAGLEYEGEFDSSKITMKRWGDFEQERRLRGGTGAASWTQAGHSDFQSRAHSRAHSRSRSREHSRTGSRSGAGKNVMRTSYAQEQGVNAPPSAWGGGGGGGGGRPSHSRMSSYHDY